MAILTRFERKKIASPWVRKFKPQFLTVTDLEAAVQYTEDRLQAAKPNYVAGLPEPFKSNTTAEEKKLLFAYTVMKDAGLLG